MHFLQLLYSVLHVILSLTAKCVRKKGVVDLENELAILIWDKTLKVLVNRSLQHHVHYLLLLHQSPILAKLSIEAHSPF